MIVEDTTCQGQKVIQILVAIADGPSRVGTEAGLMRIACNGVALVENLQKIWLIITCDYSYSLESDFKNFPYYKQITNKATDYL